MNSIRATRLYPLVRLLWLFVWTGLAIYLGLTLWWGLTGVSYPYQLDYGEGIVLWFARQMAHGQAIYKGLTGMPYASSNYPPVSMLLAALLMPIFGEGYAGGRLLAFAATLVVAALIYRLVRVETGRRDVGALAALFFIGSPYVYHWIPQFRADLVGLAFSFGGVYFVWMWERASTGSNDLSRSRTSQVVTTERERTSQVVTTKSATHLGRYLAASGVLFLLALYTKQTLFAGPAAACLVLLRHDRRLAVRYALALGVTGGVGFLAIDAATGGAFAFGLVTSNATVYSPAQLIALLVNAAVTFPVLIALALAGWWRGVKRHGLGITEWYALIAVASLVMAGRMGAWENYFLEPLAAICVVGFQSWRTEVGDKSRTGVSDSNQVVRFRLAVPILLLVQIALMWHDPRIAANLVAEGLPANRQLQALLERTPGLVISEDMGALVTSGKEVAYYTYQYSMLARSGKWDQSWELGGLRDGLFPLVVLERGTRRDVDHYGRFTRQFVSALDRFYARTQTIGSRYDIYTPSPLEHLQTADFGQVVGLVGWSSKPVAFRPATIELTVVWQAESESRPRYTAFAHLEGPDGVKVSQDDHEPDQGLYPTNRWEQGEMVRDTYTLKVPASAAPGKYTLRVGWYDSDSGDRLPVAGSPDDSMVLMTFEIKE